MKACDKLNAIQEPQNWPDAQPPVDWFAFWQEYAVEVGDYVHRHMRRLRLSSSIDERDFQNEIFFRVRRRCAQDEDLLKRLKIGGVRFTFTQTCAHFIVLERLRAEAATSPESIHQISRTAPLLPVEQEHANVFAHPDPIEIREAMAIIGDATRSNPKSRFAVAAISGDRRSAFLNYKLETNLSDRMVRRHYLEGLEILRASLDNYPGRSSRSGNY